MAQRPKVHPRSWLRLQPGLALSPHRVVAGVVVPALICGRARRGGDGDPLAALRLDVGGLLLIFEGQ